MEIHNVIFNSAIENPGIKSGQIWQHQTTRQYYMIIKQPLGGNSMLNLHTGAVVVVGTLKECKFVANTGQCNITITLKGE